MPTPSSKSPDLTTGAPPRDVRLQTLYIEVTNRCNSRCTSCVRTFDLAEPETDLAFERIAAIAAGLDERDAVGRVVLNGVGEATLHPRLTDIVELFASRGAAVLFNSNGVALTPALTLRLARAGLAELRISIDGATPATYTRLRGIDAWERVTRNAASARAALEAEGLERPALSIWFTACRTNLHEWPDMVRLAHRTGIRDLYFQRLVFRESEAFGSATREEAVTVGLSDAERSVLARSRALAAELGIALRGSGAAEDPERVVDLAGRPRAWGGCRRPYESAYVTANGNVLPCCIAPFSTPRYDEIVLGDVGTASLSDIFRGPGYAAFREAFESEEPRACCRRCGSDWSL